MVMSRNGWIFMIFCLYFEVYGFVNPRYVFLGLSLKRHLELRDSLPKRGRYDVINDYRYQTELETIQQIKTKELLQECKEKKIDISGVVDRKELEYRVILFRLKQQTEQATPRSSHSTRAYLLELENQIQKLKALPYEKLLTEMIRYNFTTIADTIEERDERIVLIARKKIQELQSLPKSSSQPRTHLEILDESEEDFEEMDLFGGNQKSQSHQKFINGSVTFLKDSFNEIGKFTDRLAFTDSEQVAYEYILKEPLSTKVPLSKEKIELLFLELQNCSSAEEKIDWIESQSRDVLFGILNHLNISAKKFEFTPLSELRQIIRQKVVEETLSITEEAGDTKLPSLNSSVKRNTRKVVAKKKQTPLFDEILFAEKSIVGTILFSFVPRLFRTLISTMTIVMNQTFELFAEDALDWSDINLPKILNGLPKISHKLGFAEYPLLMFTSTLLKIVEVTSDWAGSRRYSSSAVSGIVCLYAIGTKSGIGGFVKGLLGMKLLTTTLNHLQKSSTLDRTNTAGTLDPSLSL